MGRGGGPSGTTWWRSVVVAVVAAITQIALTVAYTSLAFRDEMAADLDLGLASMFFGLLITVVIVAVRSGLAGHVVGPQDSGLVVLSVATPTIIAATDAPGETVIVLMGLGSVGVGLTLFVLGRFGLGRVARFLPFPVLAGFLAGTGLVMGVAAFGLASSGITGTASGGGERVGRIVLAVVVAAAMTGISRSRLPTERVMPGLVLGSITAVNIGRLVSGVGRSEGADRGWLLPELDRGPLVGERWVTAGSRADWSVVVDQLPTLLPVVLLGPLTLLLYLSALETMFDVDLDTDREFRVIGGANLVASAVGSAPSYTQFANTVLVQRMAGRNRSVPLVIGGVAVVVLLVGDIVVALVPQPVVAGMLGFIAASFVLDWTWALRGRVSRVEMATAIAIAVSILVFGFLRGIAIGLALTVVWFVIQYSRASGVRRVLDGTALRSTVQRTSVEESLLAATGGEVVVAELEGYLFFGTGDSVLRRLQATDGIDAARWLVLDLRRVTGADSSAVASFTQLLRWTSATDVRLLWCSVTPSAERALAPLFDHERAGQVCADLDRALELTERDRLRNVEPSDAVEPDAAEPVAELLVEVPELRDVAEETVYEPGDLVRREGERGRGLTVVERGSVSVRGGVAGTRRRRLGPGAVLGEVSVYQGDVATATVVADERCDALEIDAEALQELTVRAPDVAARLHRHLARVLARRLVAADRVVDAFRSEERGEP